MKCIFVCECAHVWKGNAFRQALFCPLSLSLPPSPPSLLSLSHCQSPCHPSQVEPLPSQTTSEHRPWSWGNSQCGREDGWWWTGFQPGRQGERGAHTDIVSGKREQKYRIQHTTLCTFLSTFNTDKIYTCWVYFTCEKRGITILIHIKQKVWLVSMVLCVALQQSEIKSEKTFKGYRDNRA